MFIHMEHKALCLYTCHGISRRYVTIEMSLSTTFGMDYSNYQKGK